MKISVAQIQPNKGDITQNIKTHIHWIKHAIANSADAIFFPELSLIGYEPTLALSLAMSITDHRLDIFQELSNQGNITIGIGVPIQTKEKPQIGLAIFQPQSPKQFYAKRYLHEDELPYFSQGTKQVYLNVKGYRIAPAICYESLLKVHAAEVLQEKMIYMACVAKPQNGYKKAVIHYPAIAKQYKATVIMVNSIGYCDNFMSVGQSAVWNKSGELIEQLAIDEEGLLTFDIT